MSEPAAASDVESADPVLGRWALMLRAFSHRNYRLFFAGQLVSLVGTFLTQLAMPWLVYHVTSSVVLLGVVGFFGQIPMFCLAPFAGVWVDRWNRQKLLVVTQTLSMLQSFGLAAVVLTIGVGHVHAEIFAIIGLALFQGLINAFDIPGRQAFLVEMVDKREDLANAIALNSTMVHGARLVGPALGGLLIHAVGPVLCFTLDGISYIGVIAALVAMHVKLRPPRANASSVLFDLKEGMRYIRASKPIRSMLLLLTVLSLTAMPALSILMPVFARHFGGDARSDEMLGVLMGATGLGAMIAAIYLASRRTVLGLGRLISIASFVFGLAIVAFALAPKLWVALLIVPIAGMGMLMSFAAVNTLIQTLTEDHMRGRVMSFFTMAFIGMAPWGNLMAGAMAARLGPGAIGASRTLLIEGAVVLTAAAAFTIALPGIRRIMRPIYVRKGILSDPIADGLESAADVVSGPQRA